jgi:calcium-dependent protein kinase
VLQAIIYCHSNQICHRDLKPENILIETKGIIKIIDFGTAVTIKPGDGLHNIYGTAYYIAPEIFGITSYNEKCDIWSLGVILYVLLTGEPPFNG